MKTKQILPLADTARLIPGYDPFVDCGDCWFDEAAAARAVRFFEKYLTHVKGELANKPFALEPWQVAIIANLFGWKRKSDDTRRYREAFVFIPRKNGKTAMVAGLVNYVLFWDGEPGAEIYSAAADRDQARLVFEQARGMVLQNARLSANARVYNNSIVRQEKGSSYKAISAEANTKHGYNSHFIVVDELHAQPDRELVDVLATSTGARRQPMIVHITTAGYDRHSICYEKYDYACKVRDGVIPDPYFLPVIYEALAEDDWTKEATWYKANPNLGISVSLEYMQRECQRAQDSPAYENTFRRLHLNQWTEQDVRWLSMEKWDACNGAHRDLDGRECFVGLDLSSTTDLTALVAVFPDADGTRDVLARFYVPEEKAHERELRDRVPYVLWGKQAHLTATPGNVVDYEYIRRDLAELSKRYRIRKVSIDPWNATQLAVQLGQDGFDVEECRQGYATLSAPSKQVDAMVASGKYRHAGHPVLRWCASNVAVEQDAAGNIKPSKKKSTERIDGIVALVMAEGQAMVAEPTTTSVYETRGMIALGDDDDGVIDTDGNEWDEDDLYLGEGRNG